MDLDNWGTKIDEALQAQHLTSSTTEVKRGRGRPPKSSNANLGGISPDSVLKAKPLNEEHSIFVEYNPEIQELLKTTPTPFIEPEEKPYTLSTMDRLLPKPGFLTDFVNTGRGMESPTLFFVWNCLWLLSTLLKREAWLRWYPNKLWPNLYVLLVAPPALCRKSSSMIIADKLLRSLPRYLPSTLDAYKKETKIITGKTTPEGLLLSLMPDTKMLFEKATETSAPKLLNVEKGSQVALSISELAMFLGKQQYNTGMVTLLTDLFDCKDVDAEITRGRGDKPLKDIYVTLFGAITPDGLKMSVPEEAFGGGFMSRTIVAYQGVPDKIYPMPFAPEGYPKWEDLLVKLSWIAMNATGEYYLTPEAENYYREWYVRWKAELFSRANEKHEENRLDSLLLRVALLLRVQEYRIGRDITKDNIQDAKRILDYTLATSHYATEDVGTTAYTLHLNAIKRVVERRGSMSRRDLSRYMSSRGATAVEISQIVEQLSVEGFLRIRFGDSILESSTASGKEVYELMEENHGERG